MQPVVNGAPPGATPGLQRAHGCDARIAAVRHQHDGADTRKRCESHVGNVADITCATRSEVIVASQRTAPRRKVDTRLPRCSHDPCTAAGRVCHHVRAGRRVCKPELDSRSRERTAVVGLPCTCVHQLTPTFTSATCSGLACPARDVRPTGTSASHGPGGMLLLSRNRLSGSYCLLIATSRSKTGP